MTRSFPWLSFTPVILVILLLAGCGDTASDTSTTTMSQSAGTVQTSTTESLATTSTAPSTTSTSTSTTTSATSVPTVAYEEGPYEVTASVIPSTNVTRDIHVWTPVGDGPWPVVYAIPGSDGSAQSTFGVFGPELASHGVLVLATNWRVQKSTQAVFVTDIECGYRFSRSIAADYGGDITQPVTMLGMSMGASGALYQAVAEGNFGPDSDWLPFEGNILEVDEKCYPEEAARPDVMIGIAGNYKDAQFPAGVGNIQTMGNRDADYILIWSSDDTIASAYQTEHAKGSLERKDYEVTMVEIAGADHGDFVFLDTDNFYAPLPPIHPAGQATVQAVLEAIGDAG